MSEQISDNEPEMRPEYGDEVFSKGVRGKFYARYQAGTNLALLDPDVRAAFPSDAAVNAALRRLMDADTQTAPPA